MEGQFWFSSQGLKWKLGLEDKGSIIIISGPTASGKSSLALELAQSMNGELVNADSVQVYLGMDIGSAKLLAHELQGIPQHLVDICKPDQPLDVARYVKLADQAIANILARGKLPIIVGGSSLYIKALLHGLADLPASDAELRATLEARTSEDLFDELTRHDPLRAARLHPNDRRRVIRALESFLLNSASQTASSQHQKHSFAKVRYRALLVCLLPERELLYERINQRSQQMLDAGLVAEVEGLISLYGAAQRPFQALGYRQVVQALVESLEQSAMPDSKGLQLAIAQATRNFAKQQYTFWRNEPKKRGWAEISSLNAVANVATIAARWQQFLASASSNAVAEVALLQVTPVDMSKNQA